MAFAGKVLQSYHPKILKLSPPTMKTRRKRGRTILPLRGERRKRGASMDLEAEASKMGKLSLPDDSESDVEAVPEWNPRSKPAAKP